MHYESVIKDTYAQESIALETEFIANAVKTVKSFFPKLVSAVEPAFTLVAKLKEYTPTSEDTNVFKFTTGEDRILKELASTEYEDMAKLKLWVPEGFRGNMLSYFKDLSLALDYNQDVSLPALQEFYVLIASIITNKDAKKANKDLSNQTKGYAKSRVEYNKILASYFAPGSTQAEQEYRTLFKTNKELYDSYLERHKLLKKLSQISIKDYTEQVEKIKDGMQVLIDLVDDGSIQELSAVQVKNISEGAYEMAYQVEFFSVNYFRSMNLANSLQANEAKFFKRFGLE